jgi:hypothetical protein
MKTKSKKQLYEIAKNAYFDKLPGLAFMYATEDGNFFYPGNFNAAVSHAKGKKLHTISRNGVTETEKNPKHDTGKDLQKQGNETLKNGKKSDIKEYPENAKETVKQIKSVADGAALNTLVEVLKLNDDTRETVVAAFKKRSEELKVASVIPAPNLGEAKNPDELIALIVAVKEEKELDNLEVTYNLSKHADEAVVKAFETKENEFLNV